ncbi:glutathione transferase GstA [Pragia fontium]|uniref:Glutathione S-transferase n=1 Tax=Pragia fontium DSM 5563 = ATCC 49100 TaxID=1122977 RepID=A0AAJ5BHH8_9GAMM|nr:glutathione transferase GstA [Pragia fontium]AKJ42237.1 glutathione S-transferase [Pragia fontium]SFC96379.1 glutathione S-transferase [Pragia fontium DSM 5563 = ATCC 49100]VEJ55407.1 Glutathione S-transferase GST-6.0 [Pragia fontium]
MKLFYKPGACSLSPHIILNEAGLNYSVEKVDLATKKTEHGDDFLQINPKGQVPTLQLDDGSILTEGVAIVQYLAHKVPAKHLIPAVGTPEYYHAIEWLNYISTELHKGFSPLFTPQTPEEYKKIAKERLLKQFTYVDSVLQKHQFILGSTFSVADAYLFTVTNWAAVVKLDLSHLSALAAYMKRIADRPAVNATLKAEGLK